MDKLIDSEETKVSAGTWARTVVLVLALANQVLAILGKGSIPITEDQAYQLVTLFITIGSAVVTWWKNNSFTKEAIQADIVKDALKADSDAD